MKTYWRVDEISKILNIHYRTVHRWAKTGFLPAYKLGRCYRIDKEVFEDWMDSKAVYHKAQEVDADDNQ